MPTQRDYYEILGVPRSSNPEQLKGAFRNLARKYHPDVSKEPDAEAGLKRSTKPMPSFPTLKSALVMTSLGMPASKDGWSSRLDNR